MKKYSNIKKKFEKHEIDGYVIQKHEYFNNIQKLLDYKLFQICGSAGLAIILKKKTILY